MLPFLFLTFLVLNQSKYWLIISQAYLARDEFRPNKSNVDLNVDLRTLYRMFGKDYWQQYLRINFFASFLSSQSTNASNNFLPIPYR